MSIGPVARVRPGSCIDGLPEEGEMAVSVGSVVLAAAGPTVNTNGVVEWGVKNVIPIILLVIGISIIASARKGRMSENANTLTNVVIGSAVIGGAALIFAFAGQMATLLIGG
jgi:hypothetical protein